MLVMKKDDDEVGGDACVRDVRISRLKAAFEECETKLRRLRELPELSAIFFSDDTDKLGKQLTSSQKPEFDRQVEVRNRKRSDRPRITHKEVRPRSDELTRQRAVAAERKESGDASECERDPAVASLQIVGVKSLCPEAQCAMPSHAMPSHARYLALPSHARYLAMPSHARYLAATAADQQTSRLPSYHSYYSWLQQGHTHSPPPPPPSSSSRFLHPYQRVGNHQHPVYYSNQNVGWTPTFTYGDHTLEEPPCKVSRGQFWFPSDSWCEEPRSVREGVKLQGVGVPQENRNQLERDSCYNVYAYCGLSANQARSQTLVHGLTKKAGIATF
ncbi:uncharacterized protein LOC134192281 [Corticium candelabrum]|uniref:uncharacterized protein LOC134192281 n=1 Tax=Corticium candelabrum TaxID=121492 RepID=UPI002E25CEF2|nr:uncharacterized protein LOC134192281 [Corticium candelabrum]XP_062516987.1 uncharacterized protein LOC134192281 [Corticium candelabrum]XP_062516988.1 uncharacterized protein LOC134192281 [Corticium candelabrum]